MRELFRKLAHKASDKFGSPWAFGTALSIIVIWAITGPFLNFSTTWQLFINTMTTILTFLMVFLIQNTQNRDAHAIHLKLDELIKAQKDARNALIDIEDTTDEQIESLQKEFESYRNTPDRDSTERAN
jgi:low affinity Fe/Cu permease